MERETTTYACLEELMSEARASVSEAIDLYKSAQMKYLTLYNEDSLCELEAAKHTLKLRLERCDELQSAKYILKDLEKKGAEL